MTSPALLDHHRAVWAAIDTIAAQRCVSPSKLAAIAGLDRTAFNPGKRLKKNGALHWPSAGSIARVLRATGRSWADYGALVESHTPMPAASCAPAEAA